MAREPAARADELLERAAGASKRLVDGLVSGGMLTPPNKAPARAQTRERARQMFVFVILSVLLEQSAGKDPGDKETADRLKESFALELLNARKTLRTLSKKSLSATDAQELSAKLDEANRVDPFAPYYGSFEEMRRDANLGPFGILARTLSEEHFELAARARAYEKIFSLAAELSDELISGL